MSSSSTKKDLPAEKEDVIICEGNEDGSCSANGENSRLWQLFFSHRDYFVRLGLCMRKDRSPWEGWLGGGDAGGEGEDEL